MSERHDIELPNNIKLFYITKGDFATTTLDLSQTKLNLTITHQELIAELPLKRNASEINGKKVVLTTLRESLLDVTELLLAILVDLKNEP